MIKHGPLDIIALAAGEPKFDGTVFGELEKQAKKGTIRVLDALLLFKDEKGKAWSLDMEDLPPKDAARLGFIETGTKGLFSAEDAEILFEGMVPGSAVFVFAIEHVWAIDLVNAIQDKKIEVALNFRVPAPIVDEAFASVEGLEGREGESVEG